MIPYAHHASFFKTSDDSSEPFDVSGRALEAALAHTSDRGRKYLGIGGGALGALLGAGIGTVLSPEGKKLRNALIGAGIGGGAGGTAGYYLSPELPVPFLETAYRDTDTKNWYNPWSGQVKTRGLSLAELVGGLTGSSGIVDKFE